jgi:hypothetical protein
VATYNDQPATGAIRGVTLEDDAGEAISPSLPPMAGARVRGLALGDGESWRIIGAPGDGTADVEIVAEEPRVRARRGLRQALRRVRVATQASEIAEPLDMQRLVLALVSEAFGGES